MTLTDGRTYVAGQFELQDMILSLVIMSRAHEESLTKSMRVGAAWANKRANAETKPLTAMCPAWLRLSNDKSRYEVIKDRAKTIKRIFGDSAAGIGNYSITQRLNKQKVPHFGKSDGWHLSYIAKILKNRAVIGEFQPHKLVNGKRQPDGHAILNYFPAVVDDDTFYRVQLGLSQRLNHGAGRKGTSFTNIFSGIAKCAYCRSPMKFENKGKPPKGATFLVCDGAKRGLGCEIARWRYDEFEASFLAFVRELDLSQVMGSEDASKAKVLDDAIAALTGELTGVQAQREKTYDLFEKAGAAADFVAGKLSELEQRRVEIERSLEQKREERFVLEFELKAVRQSQDDAKDMLEALNKTKGDELFKLRAKVADRIRTIATTVLVAPAGDVPRLHKVIQTLEREAANEFQDVIDRLKTDMEDPKSHRRFFAVGFRNGTTRIVRPSDDDPLEFEEQLYADVSGIRLVDLSGDEQSLV